MALDPPVRPFRCRESDCDFPLGGRCSRLVSNPAADCNELVRVAPRAPTPATAEEPDAVVEAAIETDDTSAPWTGTHIEYGRLATVTARAMPKLLAVLGPHDAGKTSLLASFFLQIANGQYEEMSYRFATSKTLLAFDNLILRANQWSGTQDTQIVEHTPKSNSSEFLHLGFRPLTPNPDEPLAPRVLDVLISDIAGETTSSWSQNATGDAAASMAFVRHSQAILVLADAQRLMDLAGRAYDAEIAGIIRRVTGIVRRAHTPPCVSLVFTKLDLVPGLMSAGARATVPYEADTWKDLLRAGGIRTALQALSSNGTHIAAFSLSAFPTPMSAGQPAGVIAPFQHAIQWADRGVQLVIPRLDPTTNMPSIARYGALPGEWER